MPSPYDCSSNLYSIDLTLLLHFQPKMDSKSKSPMTKNDKLHIVMFPWLAFGHMIPFLELSKLIAQKGHRVTFVSTPQNIDRLPKLPPNLSPRLTLVKIPLPHVEKLPENAEATVDLPYDKIKYLKMAYDQLEQPITQLLHNASPDWVIYDFASYWVGPAAAKLGISSAYFSIFIATSLCFFGPSKVLMGMRGDSRTKPEDFTVQPKWVPFESTVAFRLFEINRIFDDVTGDDENIPATYRLGAAIDGCDVVAVRSSYEFEPEWLQLLPKINQKPVIPVGLLPPMPPDHDSVDDTKEWRTIKEWLDKQPKRSVVYVAFGSEAKPSQDELTEIALGLEQTGFPFFWALRKKQGLADTEAVELPDGFEERTKGRGIVCTSWAPQLEILSHDSVGGFFTHSGWSSVVEAIQFEKPLILLSFLADTGLIARVLEEKKMGYVVPRDDRDGSFTSDSVADSVRLVMVEEGGKIYRDKVREAKGLFVDRDTQDKYVNGLLDYFKTHSQEHKA
ncbi:UDP-glycosyltransferase 91A1-like [Rhododendron vialii]|uniref:UDP-glycosyltransferase 91A1-like n=1 Tax=Rhododendron vialii TaxID=182163 RepID=UPI00265EBB02|nr:UDP-glycosyltransferase 91A1-like [Rhododendron vialii]